MSRTSLTFASLLIASAFNVACSGKSGDVGGSGSGGTNALAIGGSDSGGSLERTDATATSNPGATSNGGSTSAANTAVSDGGAPPNSSSTAMAGGSPPTNGGANGTAAGGTGTGAAPTTNNTNGTSGGRSSLGGSPNGGRSPATAVPAGGVANGGSVAAGGKATGGSATGGALISAGAANAGSCVPATCGSHKWACWKMPNPTGSGLPNTASYGSTTDVVHDNVTCLDWQRNPPSTTYTNADAIAYCEGLSLGGYDDWRAPTRIEMMSILDWTRSPATDAAFSSASGFHKTGSNWVLVIDQKGAGAGSDSAWAFNLSDGITSNNQSGAKADRVRCVRGNGDGEGFSDKAVAPPNQYMNLSADEVQDNYTGLIWQRAGDASGLISWEDAVTYCQTLTLGGATWRLPSVRELSTLVDEAQVAPAINRTAFQNTKYGSKSNNWYWASHRQRGSTTASWGLNFDDGFTGFNAGSSGSWNYWTAAYAKCVR